MAEIYKSKYTGEEIDSLLTKTDSIEANPSGEATEELTKLTIGDKTYYIPESTEGTVVEANPTEAGSTDLASLKVGDTVYNVPSGSGGTEVVANPTETGSTDLTSLKVGDTVYNVPSGSGSGSDKALIVYLSDGYRPLNVYFDNEGTGTVEGTIKSSSTYSFFQYFTGFTDYVYFKGDNSDDIYIEDSGKAVNCDVEFSGTYNCQTMKVSNVNGIGIVTITTSTEPL